MKRGYFLLTKIIPGLLPDELSMAYYGGVSVCLNKTCCSE
jgi:hypothetical protein